MNVAPMVRYVVTMIEDKLIIPDRLHNKQFRFIKVVTRTKRPMEEGWTETVNYKYTEQEFKEYLKENKSYGVACGFGNLAVLDEDHESVGELIEKSDLPKTFTVKTGSGKRHFYYIIPDLEKKVILEDFVVDGKTMHRGELQWKGQQVIGPGSLHPSGNKYEVLDDNEIATVSQEKMLTILEPFLKINDKEILNKWRRWEEDKQQSTDDEPQLTSLINTSKLNHRGNEYQGEHPVHGSRQREKGTNFSINEDKNLWHCFRCDSGGNGWTWIAVAEGIIDCKDAKPGCLNNKNTFKKVVKAYEKTYKIKDKMTITKEQAIEMNKELYGSEDSDIEIPKSLDEVYDIVQKWLFLPNTERIDLVLATALTVEDDDLSLWIFFVGGSGDAKSELLKGLEGLPYTRKIDQLTANTLASGKPDVKDLGSKLANKSTLLLFTDLACLTSLNKDEKKQIWGQFRTLYDGEIYKDTGSGVTKKYNNCNVSILAATTSAIKDEYHIHQQLGTRELLWDTNPDPRNNEAKMRQAIRNNGKKKQMRQEIRIAFQGFLSDKEYKKDIEIPDEVQNIIYKQCEKLRLLRASGNTDWKTGEVATLMEAEVTTRLVQQFCKIYRALYSLDPKYPVDRFYGIIEKFVKSCSNTVRYQIYEHFKKNNDWINPFALHQKLKVARLSIAAQCEILWYLGALEKEFREEQIGYDGSNRWRQVAYYKSVITQIQTILQKENDDSLPYNRRATVDNLF